VFVGNNVVIASGQGVPNIKGCQGTIHHIKGDRKTLITFDTSANGVGKGSATLQVGNNVKCSVFDENMSNNKCNVPVQGG